MDRMCSTHWRDEKFLLFKIAIGKPERKIMLRMRYNSNSVAPEPEGSSPRLHEPAE
jgi:hypothetical protein